MKKVFLFLCVLAVVFTGCKKSEDKEEQNPYIGKYKGTFTTIGENQTQKEATITISKGVGENLQMNYLITMKKISDGRYEYEGQNDFTTAMLSTLINLCGISSDLFDGTVENISVDARFTESTLTMEIDYKTDLGITITSTFTGKKQ
ncbi:MAG: hypothetical protein MJZ76_08855 [Bacteroidales bacterium]|nr:hypothetical protein [Bacteroidales bacterium]